MDAAPASGKDSMSQNEQVLQHIDRHGFIEPDEAYRSYGILALHSRAAELRAQGHDIHCQIITRDGKRWGRYSMVRG